MYTKRRKLAVLLVAALMLNVVQPVLAYEEEPGVGTEETTIQNEEVEEEKESESEGIGGNVDMDSAPGARSVDTTAPTVDLSTLTVSTKEAVAGDKVVISFKVEDESLISSVRVYWNRPISGQREGLKCAYNSETGHYECIKEIDKNTQSGIWKIDVLSVEDQYENVRYYRATDYDFSVADFQVSGTNVDSAAPVIAFNTLMVSQESAVLGDKVVISFKVEDESEIKEVRLYWKRPITGQLEGTKCSYNSETGYYECVKIIDENTQSGIWTLESLYVMDEFNNEQSYFAMDYDWSAANFEVIGTEADAEAPVVDLSSITISSKEMTYGDLFTISFKVEDASNITRVFLNLETPDGIQKTGSNCKYNAATGYYEYTKTVDNSMQCGVWKIKAILVEDEYYNQEILHGKWTDMSAANFAVYENADFIKIPALDNLTPISVSTTLSNRTIKGDIYIGPDAFVTMDNVTVTGNIYVLGVLSASNISAKALYARRILTGTSSNEMGTTMLSGNIGISHQVSTNYVIDEIPYRLQETPMQCIDGKLQVKGATLDFAEITVDGNPVKAPVNSKFMHEQEFQNGDEVTLAIKIPYYNIIRTEKIPVVQMTTTTDGGVQYKPVIETDEITLEQNQEYDLTQLIKATDKEDGDVSASLQVIDSDLDITTGGTYFVTVSVADSNGATTEKRIVVKVSAPLKSISLDKTQVTIQKGGEEQLTVSYNPENTTDDRTVSWSSSDETIVTVNENGKLIAIGGGKAEVTATVGDKKAVCEVVVEVPLESIALNKEIMSLAIGGSEKLTVSYSPADATVGEKVVWRSDNEAAVTVDGNGVVKAVATGTAKITASIGNIEASCSVTAGVLLESLEMSQAELTLEENEIQSLSVNCYPENTTVDQTAVIWKSSDESIVTVDENGRVNGVGVGTATITALLAGQQAICNVTVTEGHKWIYTIPETEFAKVQVGDLFSIGFARSIKMQVVEGHMSAKLEEEIWSGSQLCRFTQAGMVTLSAEWQAHDSEKRYQKLFRFIVSDRVGDVKTTYLIKNTFKIGEPLSDEPAVVKKVVRFENCLYGSELSGLYGISQKTLEDLGNWFIIPDWGGAFSEYQNRTSFGLMPGYAAYQPGIFEIAAVSGEQVIGAPHNVEIEEAEVEVSVPKQVVAGDKIQISSRLGNTACKNLPVADIKTDLFIQEPGLEYDLGFQPTLEILEGEQLIQRENGDYSHTLESSEELTFTGSGKVRMKLSYKMINPYENGDGREFHPYNPEKIIEINVIEPVPIESVQLSAEMMELDLNEKTQLSAQVLPENTTESKYITWSSSDESVLTVDENGNVHAVGLGEAVVSASAGEKTGNCKVTVKLKPVSKGDINLDGEIDASDLMYMLQVVSERIGKEELTGSQVLAGDVEGNDGEITVDDLMKLLQYVSERITSLE